LIVFPVLAAALAGEESGIRERGWLVDEAHNGNNFFGIHLDFRLGDRRAGVADDHHHGQRRFSAHLSA